MDILNPELLWIGTRCYRVNIPNDNRTVQHQVNYGEEEEEDEFACQIDETEFYEIETIDNGSKFQLKVHVPQAFHAQIIGSKGAVKKRLEQETGCQITVPKINSKENIVILKSASKKAVISAKTRLDMIVIAGRSKLQFTHFLSVPFTTPEIVENYIKFKESILADRDIFGMDSSLFQNPQKLHLTIVTLALLDNEDRAVSAEMLQDCKDFIIDAVLQGGPLRVRMQALDYMNDDPSSVDVLYAKVISEQLQEIADGIAGYFESRGFARLNSEHVKMHVTLINSLFRDNDDAIVKEESQQQERGKQQQQRTTFDAREILRKHREYFFGEMQVSELHLSQRFSKSPSNGYYESTGILKI